MTIFNRRDAQDGRTGGDSNSGVYNTGTMGDVQNLANSAGSVANHVTVSGGADAKAAEWTRILGELETALARGGAGVTDPEQCRVLLGLIRDQRITDEGDRLAAGSMLGRISRLCTRVEPVTSLVASALTLLGLATG